MWRLSSVFSTLHFSPCPPSLSQWSVRPDPTLWGVMEAQRGAIAVGAERELSEAASCVQFVLPHFLLSALLSQVRLHDGSVPLF